MVDLDSDLLGVLDKRTAQALKTAFGMRTVRDLLQHYPRRYVSRSVLTPLSDLQVDEHVTVMAEVLRADVIRPKGPRNVPGRRTPRTKDRLTVEVTDGSARLQLTFFNQAWRAKSLIPGTRGLFSGKVGEFRGRRQLTHPDYQLLPDDSELSNSSVLTSNFIAVYPATGKVSSWAIASSISLVLDALDAPTDPLPESVCAQRGLLSLADALRLIHRPESEDDWQHARRRLKFDEAFLMQLALAKRRQEIMVLTARERPVFTGGIADEFDTTLPFPLTDGQVRVGGEIAADLARPTPMHRLLQGDVGSGKTIVALRAMLQVVDAGGQAVLLAPTEVLAQQHFKGITDMLGTLGQGGTLMGADSGTRVALLTASVTAARQREVLLEIASGAAGIVVGTHALLEDRVQYADLGLVVVDEQHRFGVEQRATLTTRGGNVRPHVLVMTATPIPRTIAMTVFGDLETSTLLERPQFRAGTRSFVVGENDPDSWISRAWERVRDEVASGHQAFVVCPRIDENDALDADGAGLEAAESTSGDNDLHSVAEVSRRLKDGPLSDLRVSVLHGRLPSEEKDDVMTRFSSGSDATAGIDVLVSTTVVEVGVDVPNATMMVIMDADRFGVSQLHQLRGRVGRGEHPGLCLLVTRASRGSTARERLEHIAATEDGFELARLDLSQRREGDILGAAQSGRRSSLKLLSVLRDEDLIAAARDDAGDLVAADPALQKHPLLRAEVEVFEREADAEYLEKG